jgi:hypothetical protein
MPVAEKTLAFRRFFLQARSKPTLILSAFATDPRLLDALLFPSSRVLHPSFPWDDEYRLGQISHSNCLAFADISRK